MITDDGGKLIRTINYTPEENLQTRYAEVAIDEKENGKAKVRTINTGIQYENDNLNWAIASEEKQKKCIEKSTAIPNFNINSFSIKERKNKIP